ncbi:MAG: V-type ATP synthase subunit I [Rikenellaceae bacterium]
MIVRMSKYQFVLYSAECDGFVDRLRDLGMVDITTSAWEASDADRALIMEVEAIQKADKFLSQFAESESFDGTAASYTSGEEALGVYRTLVGRIAELDAEIVDLQKMSLEAAPWGEFDGEVLRKLDSEGLTLSFYVAAESTFDVDIVSQVSELTSELTIVPISRVEGRVYFVLVGRCGEQQSVDIDAQQVKTLLYSSSQAEAKIAEAEAAKSALSGDMSRVALSREQILMVGAGAAERLQLSRISGSAEEAAEGSLLVMEAWAEEAKSAEVDALLNSQEGLFYLKSSPTPEDNTPIKLENNRYARLFEMVSNLYALPKYGTIDLTPFFAPFYMLFFAICLCDAGYGAILLMAGLALYFKGGDAMRQPAWLTIVCGTTAVLFGMLTGSAFGVALVEKPVIDFQADFFYASMGLGIVQILFGMLINIFVTTRSFGLKYAFGSIGWFIMLLSAILSGVLSAVGVEGFGFDSVAFYAAEGVGLAMLLLLNSPGQNIFANLGAGVWQTYDRATGLLGDVLSYVRLFAIGLSGGVLALVFNNLALGLTGLSAGFEGLGVVDMVLKVLGASIILLIGHGINLFMSTISSFVHPMRLTFVEFYKNAGFEMSSRKFEPLERE